MSDKAWVDGVSGMYTRKPTRGKFRGATVYCGRVWLRSQGKFKHFVLGTALKKATERLREIQVNPEAALEQRARAEVKLLTFGAVVDEFLDKYQSRGGTSYYDTILKPVRAFFGSTAASTIRPADLDRYLAHRRTLKWNDGSRRISDSSLRKEIIATATCFKWAKRNAYVPSNPADAESVPRPVDSFDPQSVRWLMDDQLADLKGKSSPWLRDVIAWATETGMDKGKVRRLRWPELDLDRDDEGRIVAGRFAMQRDKTGKPMRQVLSAGALDALNRVVRTRHTSGTIFLDEKAQPIEEKVLDWALGCAYKAAGIVGCNFRTFRHTYATRALRRGVPREVVAKTMAHTTAFISERYMHVADDQLEAAARAMSGPERLSRNGDTIPKSKKKTVPPAVPPADGHAVGAAQVVLDQLRRGAGVAEQGCLLSSCSG